MLLVKFKYVVYTIKYVSHTIKGNTLSVPCPVSDGCGLRLGKVKLKVATSACVSSLRLPKSGVDVHDDAGREVPNL